MSVDAAATSTRFERNLAALEAWMPALVQRLREHQHEHGDPQPLIPAELEAEAARLEAWLADPIGSSLFTDPRLLEGFASTAKHLEPTGVTELQALTLKNIHDLAQDLQYSWAISQAAHYAMEQGLICETIPRFTAPRGLLLYGIGSGRLLPAILERSQADVVLIFEPDRGRLLAALQELDLAEVLPPYSGPGRGFYIITSRDVDQAFEETTALLCQSNLFVLDALLVCDTDPERTDPELRERFSAVRQNMLIGYMGFFTDELHMLMNATTSFRHLGAFVLYPGVKEPHKQHAVIAVSGPSLRQYLPLLKAERERYTLFSGWSTLGTLIHAGIVPDFHCPMERHVVHDFLADPAIAPHLASMALVGPSSLDPRQMSPYADRFIAFRSASAASAVYGEAPQQLISSEGPITVNMATLAAVLLGFRRLHLFGADFGAIDLESKRMSDALADTPYIFPLERIGVAGSKVYTDNIMLDARRALEGLLSGWHSTGEAISAWNYGQGLCIKGAPGATGDEFASLLRDNSSRQTYEFFRDGLPRCDIDWAEQRWRLARMRQRCLQCLRSLRELVQPTFEPATLLAITDMANVYFGKSLLEQIPLRLYRGTVFRTWFSLLMLQRRLRFPDAAAEQAFLEECRRILYQVLDSLEALSFELFDYLEDLGGLDDFNYPSRLRPPA